MTYEIAKQLKEAGFTFPALNTARKYSWYRHHFTLTKNGVALRYHLTRKQIAQMELVGVEVIPAPTLSELVAACPPYIFDEEFNVHAAHEKGVIEWCACYISPSNLEGSAKYLSVASTPEEAVAMLYLALHGKTRTPVEG